MQRAQFSILTHLDTVSVLF